MLFITIRISFLLNLIYTPIKNKHESHYKKWYKIHQGNITDLIGKLHDN